ncbi:pneumococcal-type histidine triad protein [Streptococcus zalophi]|uniref:pneumococcal-type histidine triad protein n=1 Tax=Streptococcus zalophi TaxID=640031 RepID=UPI00215CFAA8|nr:pneumococcal-type histidine triad protein [Streptococcus zalophi]MCR8968042.1 pneumococcal-type histidine triad protein [Streptococcus zalophi]
MKKNLTIVKILSLILAGYFMLAACQATSNDSKKDDNKVTTQEVVDHDDHDDHDGLVVVSEIMADGFAHVHGDHDHFEEGKIPGNAKFLDSTLPADDYVFDEKDVVYNLDEGSIIKVNDKFYYYPNDKENTDTILTKEEAMALTEGDDHDEDHDDHDDHHEDHE